MSANPTQPVGDASVEQADAGDAEVANDRCDAALADIDKQWQAVRESFRGFVSDYSAGPRRLYDAQGQLSNFLALAHATSRSPWLSDLADAYGGAAAHLSNVTSYKKQDSINVSLTRPMNLWLNDEGEEEVLSSAQFLYAITLLLHGLGTSPKLSQSTSGAAFLDAYLDTAVRDHLLRWIIADGASTGVFGGRWKCEPTTLYTHAAHMQNMTNNVNGSYCNTLGDVDMFIGTAAIHLAELYDRNPDVFAKHAPNVIAEQIETLRSHGETVANLFLSRFVFGTALDRTGTPVEVAVLDPNAYYGYGDYNYSGYTGAAHPWAGGVKLPVNNKAGVGHDFSHARRIVLVFDTLARVVDDALEYVNPQLLARVQAAQARAVAFRVYVGDDERAAFSTYMDGTNGWFRVGQTSSGFLYGNEPDSWAQGRSFLTGGFGSLALWEPTLESIWTLAVEREAEMESSEFTPFPHTEFDPLNITAGDPKLLACRSLVAR